jgi:hypothetical protein
MEELEMGKKKTTKDFKIQVSTLTGNEYEVLGEYKKPRVKVRMKHIPCGNVWDVTPDCFLYKASRCPECARKKTAEKLRLSQDTVEDRYSNQGYQLITEYRGNSKKVTAICPKGHTWEHLPSNFTKGQRCFECNGAKKYSLEQVKLSFTERGFIPLFEYYDNNKEYLPFMCPKHIEYGIQYARFVNMRRDGANCKKCYLLMFTGENSSLWKGGLTSINHFLRGSIYEEWTKPSLAYHGFKCAITNLGNQLEVHHLNNNFSEIVKEIFSSSNLEIRQTIGEYSQSEIDQIKALCNKLHKKHGLGIPLKKEIHNLFHKVYGNKNNNPNQFDEFKKRYSMGEFDNSLPLELKSRSVLKKRIFISDFQTEEKINDIPKTTTSTI